MDAQKFAAFLAFLAMSSLAAYATDPSQLQDFCVFTNDATVFLNGFPCKNPQNVTVDDFFFTGLNKAGATNNNLGSNVTPVTPTELPGLNTLGISIARLDFAPQGLIPPHYHPRASEILTVLEGTLYVGFVTSNQPTGGNRLFTNVLYTGDVFLFPQGLIHFQFNLGSTNAVALSALSSQNPGLVTVGNAVFGSTPNISIDVLAKAFQVESSVIKLIESHF